MVFPCSALILFLSVTQKNSTYGFLYATERNLGLETLQKKVAVQWTVVRMISPNCSVYLKREVVAGVSHSDWIASGTIFFLWDKVFAVAWVTIQGGYNSSLLMGLAVYILYF